MAKRTIEDIYEEILEEKENIDRAKEIINESEMNLHNLKEELRKKQSRKDRYWKNKEEENLRSKIWRLTQKLERMIKEKEDEK